MEEKTKEKIIKIIFSAFIFLIFTPNISYSISDTSEIIQEQQETFGISDFIKETEKYTDDFFGDISISDMINDAITGKVDNNTLGKKFLSLLGSEIKNTLQILVGILVIVLIHSILKAITDNLEDNSVSKIIYYVQYILIVTLIMTNFSSILDTIKETIHNLIGFMNCLIPMLITLMLYTGSIVTSGLLQPIILFVIEFIGNIIEAIIIPIVSIITVLIIVSKVSEKIQVSKLASFMKSSVIWFLGIILTLFVGVLSLEGTLTSSVDGITAKTAKAAVSSLIPVVGKVLGDTVDSVLGCGIILKNAIGVVGVIIIIGICIIPIIKLATLSIMYSISSAVIEPLADEKIVKLLTEMGGIFKLLLGLLSAVSVLLIIGITIVIKISNTGMMYR